MTALIFDVANVIVDWDPMRALAGAVPDEVANDFLAAEVFWELNARTDAGMPLADAVVEMDDQAPHLVDVYRVYLERFPLTVSGPIAGTAEVIRELLAAGVRCYGLSNWAKENFNIARRANPVIDELADVIVSGEVGLAKPDPDWLASLITRRVPLSHATEAFSPQPDDVKVVITLDESR